MSYQESPRAPADIINGALTMLVCALLTLRPEHRAKLMARGLSDYEIRRLRYVSAPATREERRRVADALAPLPRCLRRRDTRLLLRARALEDGLLRPRLPNPGA